MSQAISRLIRFFRPPLPRSGTDQLATLAAKALYSATLALMAWSIAYGFTVLPFYIVRKAATSDLLLILTVACVGALYCLRRGSIRLGGWIFLSGIWLVLSITVVFSGGMRSPALFVLLAPLATSAWLLGRRGTLVWATVFIVQISIFGGLDFSGISFPRYFPLQPLAFPIVSMMIVLLVVFPLSHMLSMLDLLLAQSTLQQSIAMEVTAARDLPSALGVVMQKVCEKTGWACGQAWIPSSDGKDLVCLPTWFTARKKLEPFRAASQQISFRPGDGLPGRVWAERKPIWIQDIAEDGNFARADNATNAGLRSAVGIPILSGDRVIVVIEFFLCQVRAEDAHLVKLMTAVAAQLGQFIDRKRTEDQLQMLNNALDQTADAVIITDSNGVIEYVNPAFEELSGYLRSEALGNTPRLVKSGNHDRALYESMWANIVAGDTFRAELVNKKQSGELFEVDETITPMRDIDGRTHFIATWKDITSRRKAEALLRNSEAELLSFVDAAPYGICRSKLETNEFVYVNPALVRMLGYSSAEEVLALNLETDLYLEPEDRIKIATLLEDKAAYRDLELHWKKKAGTEIVVRASGRIVGTPAGERYVESIVEDVTEKLQLEQQLRHAQKMEAIGRLAGGVAHDFNNILGVILGYSELCIAEPSPEDIVVKHVGEIKAAAGSAAKLTKQLLTFSRKDVIHPRILDLNAVVKNVSQMISRTVGDDISVAFRPGAGLGSIKADAGQIEQVLMNLAVNARDAMPKGGEIALVTENVTLEEHYSATGQKFLAGKYVMLSFSDTGCGMPEETKAHIFEPFFTTKEPGKGTGLGLSTVYGIVTQGGGDIAVYSEPNLGTTFKIYFPRADARAANLQAPNETGATETASQTVLLVDDDRALRRIAMRLLRSAGYRVLEAEDADSAIQITKTHADQIDLLLTDFHMPNISGVELCSRLRDLKPELKAILMSGYAGDTVDGQTGFSEGLVVIEKPFTRQTLLAKVGSVLHVA